MGEWDLEGEDDDLALVAALHAGVAVGLKARVGRECDLLLPGILPQHRPQRAAAGHSGRFRREKAEFNRLQGSFGVWRRPSDKFGFRVYSVQQ